MIETQLVVNYSDFNCAFLNVGLLFFKFALNCFH